MESDNWNVSAIAAALRAEIKGGAVLPARMVMKSERLGTITTLRVFSEQRRLVLNVDLRSGKPKSFLAQVSLNGVVRVEIRPDERSVLFHLESGEALIVRHDGRFSIGRPHS